ncbi:hypothetical protein ACHAXR_000839 [Thalassiosira sp. AJA248-18]
MEAIRAGNYDTWPGLTTKAVYKFFPESEETQKGHMKGQRQNFRSTKPTNDTPKEEKPSEIPPPKKEHSIFVKVVDLKETMYSDQTGKFPYLSSRGMRYIMVAFHTDPNYIFAEPMRNRTERQMIEAYDKIVQKMKSGGLGIKLHILDNEISAEYKAAIKANGATHQLVPPGDHRRNMAERAIQTFKDHFIVHPQNLSLCPFAWPPQFHEATFSPLGLSCFGTRKARQKRDVVRSCNKCMEFRNINGTPSMLQNLQQNNKSGTNRRHGIFQTQIPYLSNNHTRGCSCCGSTTIGASNRRQFQG